MSTNYDQLRAERDDLEFTIGGQDFRFRLVPMSMIGVWTEREEPVNAESVTEFMEMMVNRVADAVDNGNGARERWLELCADEQSGPSYGELLELGRKAWTVQTEVPTKQPEPSGAGRGASEPSSKAA